MHTLVPVFFIVAVASFIQGMTGFGFGLIALPLFGFFLDIKTGVPVIILLPTFISLALTWQLRKNLDFKLLACLVTASLPGVVLGSLALKHLPPRPISLCLGLIMMSFTAYQLLVRPESRILGRMWAVVASFLTGFLGASVGAGGPPIIIYSTIQPWTKEKAKATMAALFSFVSILAIAMHAATGMITRHVLTLFAMSFPIMCIGSVLGIMSYKHLSDGRYKKMVFVMVFFLGCIMVYRNI